MRKCRKCGKDKSRIIGCLEDYCPEIDIASVNVIRDSGEQEGGQITLDPVPYGDKELDDFIFKPLKKFSWRKTKNVLRKVINNPIIDAAIEFTPRPVRVSFSWLNQKLIQSDMIKDKKWYKSKTVWSAILIALTAVLQALGVDVAGSPETMQVIYEVAFVLAGAFGLVGLRAAIGDKINKDE